MDQQEGDAENMGRDEFEAHLASGRIRWRESPTTWGVWEYPDTQDLEKNFKVSKGRTTARGVEYDPAEQEEEAFDSLWQADGHTGVLGLCQDGAKGSLGKGNTSKGLGKGQGLAKGKGLAKGQGKSQQLAIKDKEVEDEEQDEEKDDEDPVKLLKRAKRARDECSKCINELEETLQKAKSRLSKMAKDEIEKKLQALKKVQDKLKDLLLKKPGPPTLKKALVECANMCKQAKEEAKELKQLANKAASKASTSR